jgi:hypothetical protein
LNRRAHLRTCLRLLSHLTQKTTIVHLSLGFYNDYDLPMIGIPAVVDRKDLR